MTNEAKAQCIVIGMEFKVIFKEWCERKGHDAGTVSECKSCIALNRLTKGETA